MLRNASRRVRERMEGAWPLWSVLAAQATLTLPWIWRTAPYTDEALYISTGHSEWAHWLHHVPIPQDTSIFSGTPVIYPPVAALADSAGGLTGARVLALGFVLITTALIYLIGDRLFGRVAGILGALIFAVCGLVVHYGALATFDPLAMLFLALATWAALRLRDGSNWWLLACPVALALANAVKYGSLAWDPVVIAALLLYAWSKGRAQALFLAASVAVTALVLDVGILMLGGTLYAQSIIVTTIFRTIQSSAPTSSAVVLLHAADMTGPLLVAAIAGVVVSIVKKMPTSAICFLCLMVLAGLIAPIDQARIHQLSSLDRNMSFGMPFLAVGAGYALGVGRQWLARRVHWGQLAATTAVVFLVLAVLIVGRFEKVQFRGPGHTTAREVIHVIGRHYLPHTFVLADTSARMEQYYLPLIPAGEWRRSYASQFERNVKLLTSHCFSIVVLEAQHRSADKQLLAELSKDNYRRLEVVGTGIHQITIWVPGRHRPRAQTVAAHAKASKRVPKGTQSAGAGACGG